MKKWMIIMLVGAALVFGSVFGLYAFKQKMISQFLANRPEPTVSVTAVAIEARDWTPTISAIGFIDPDRGVTLGNEAAGVVNTILFDSGQHVEQGALLVQLDSVKEQADLRASEGRLVSVHNDLDRMRRLAERSAVSRNELDAAEADYLSLQGQIDSLKATIARRDIRAPFAGITGIRQINLGQYLQAGTAVVRLENIDVMRIRFIVAERDYTRIVIGMPIRVKVDAYPDRIFKGAITAIEPAVDYQSGVVQVQASIPNSERQLRAGMYAQVEITEATLPNQVVVSQSAINFTLYGEYVYLVESKTPADGGEAYDAARQVTVTVAERRGDDALISQGLTAGERIVTSGQLKLSNGTRVKVVQDDTLTPPTELPRQ